jgi:hypothetical protein
MRRALAVLFVVAAIVPIRAEENPKSSADVRRERIDRVNKVWDAQIERIRGAQIAAKCKAEAKKQYSAIHFKKRRVFVKNCIEQGRS